MAFILKPEQQGFYFPITVPVVTESGATQAQKFEFKFKRVSREKLNELQKAQTALASEDFEVDSLERDTDYVQEIAEGWRYVQDATGQDLPFTRENIRAMLNQYPQTAGKIVSAFFEATLGGGKKGN